MIITRSSAIGTLIKQQRLLLRRHGRSHAMLCNLSPPLESQQSSMSTTTMARAGGSGILKRSVAASDKHNHNSKQRYFSLDSKDLRSYYHIEASNAARPDATALTVSGPDVDGMLASMTVALALRGCSLVELHAAKSDDVSYGRFKETDKIKDIFYVVNRETGEPFPDGDLLDLAVSLLESLRSPMALVSSSTLGNGGTNALDALKERLDGAEPYDSLESQITIVPAE